MFCLYQNDSNNALRMVSPLGYYYNHRVQSYRKMKTAGSYYFSTHTPKICCCILSRNKCAYYSLYLKTHPMKIPFYNLLLHFHSEESSTAFKKVCFIGNVPRPVLGFRWSLAKCPPLPPSYQNGLPKLLNYAHIQLPNRVACQPYMNPVVVQGILK